MKIAMTPNTPLSGMRILVCPSGFKGSLHPEQAANCIESGILNVLPTASVRKVPLVDGGEGFTRALVAATGGEVHPVTVTGPVGAPVDSFFGILGNDQIQSPRGSISRNSRMAVIEMAAAAGLSLVPAGRRNPGLTSTYGVGELMAAALDAGADRIVVGCGDSGTCDGGAGMLQALGARLLDSDGQPLPVAVGGETLTNLAAIDLAHVDARLERVTIDVAVNWSNVLCGPKGVARVFGAQKGASDNQTERLAAAMDMFAQVTASTLSRQTLGDISARHFTSEEIGLAAGSGASGGLGTGLRLIGATLRPRYEVVAEYVDFDTLFDDCDLVVTAEGGIDRQTPQGKIPAEIGMRAKKYGLPVVAIAGTIGDGARVNYEAGIDAYTCILQRPGTLEEAVAEAEKLTRDSAECVMRMIVIGRKLANRNLVKSEGASSLSLESQVLTHVQDVESGHSR